MMFLHRGMVALRTGCSVLLAAGLTILGFACGGDGAKLVTELEPLEAHAVPEWNQAFSSALLPPEESNPEFVKIYLDTSIPMGGFLPPRRTSNSPPFQLLGRNLANHMAREFHNDVQWFGVGRQLRSLGIPLPFNKAMFNQTGSDLNLAVADACEDFRSGRAEAAALISDLLVTGGVSGPLGLDLGCLRDAIQKGVYHVGLFGMKADYWGVSGRRFDELNQRWVKMRRKLFVPVYVLVLGRGQDKVKSIMRSIQSGLPQSLDMQWELLTDLPRRIPVEISCNVPEEQFALYLNDQKEHSCGRSDPVKLTCSVESELKPRTASAIWKIPAPEAERQPSIFRRTANWIRRILPGGDDADEKSSMPEIQVEGSQLIFDLECSEFRGSTFGNLHIEVIGDVEEKRKTNWDDWSTQTDDPGKTLHLKEFVEKIRLKPDHYKLLTPSLLRFR